MDVGGGGVLLSDRATCSFVKLWKELLMVVYAQNAQKVWICRKNVVNLQRICKYLVWQLLISGLKNGIM